MMSRNLAGSTTYTTTSDTIDSSQLGLPLTSPFARSFTVAKDGGMIKQAVPQQPHGLTKLQHRLLYETDSDSSFDLTFSSPSSIGSASEYSDVAFNSSRSRTSSHGRRMGGHGSHSSRSESVSSVLGSSLAIQRVLMGNNTASAALNKPNRQSVRDIAAAFEQNTKSGPSSAQYKPPSQLGRVDEKQPLGAVSESRQNSRYQVSTADHDSTATAPSAQSNGSRTARSPRTNGPIPAKLKIFKEPVKGPLSAPPAITPESSSQHRSRGSFPAARSEFVFPPRDAALMRSSSRVRSLDGIADRGDDDEPLFDIVPSPSRRREFPQSIRNYSVQRPPISPRVSSRLNSSRSSSGSPSVPSSASTMSRNSMDSTYSNDSMSGHPFSLQLPNDDRASLIDVDEKEAFSSLFIGFVHAQGEDERKEEVEIVPATPALSFESVVPASVRTSTATLQPLLLSASRPSSACSTSTLTPINTAPTPSAAAAAAASMRVNEETTFPLPPFTATDAVKASSTSPRSRALLLPRTSSRPAVDLGAVDELKREAQALLASIRTLGDEIDASIPSTHHLTPITNEEKGEQGAFVATDTTYTQIWSLMDTWYWSSFELSPQPNPLDLA